MTTKQKKRPKGRPKGMPRTAAEIAADAKRTGRPGLSPDAKGTLGVTMRLAPPDYRTFTRDAKQAGMGLAAFLRHCWRVAKENNYGDDIQDNQKTNRPGDGKKGGRNRD